MAKLVNLKSFKDFLRSSTGGGILLFASLLVSLIVANSPLADAFGRLLALELGFEGGAVHLRYSVSGWINDGLMAVFFLLVGLEIKRELVEGELSSPRQAALPILCACGGALVPAAIYALLNMGTETHNGWGIPMATDIAFALAVLTMLGRKVPGSLKIFLAALAIVDDLLAILVIAVFYSGELHYAYLLYAAGGLALLALFNRFGVTNIWMYLLPGLLVWYFVHHSGIHATIAGVLVAMALPTTPDDRESPLEKSERILTKPVNFLVLPLFALANTNITFHADMLGGLSSAMGLGIILGLFFGKMAGIFGTCWLCVTSRLARLPERANWKHIAGVGMLGGIGFTMSIFMSILSFGEPKFIEEAKFAVLAGSLISGICGYAFLRVLGRKAGQPTAY